MNGKDPKAVDGENACKLVKALETCTEIYAIIFIYTDRFSTPHKLWYDRIVQLVGSAYQGHIILLHNKQPRMSDLDILRNEMQLQQLLPEAQGKVEYFPFCNYNNENDPQIGVQVDELFGKINGFVPFSLKDLKPLEVCYDGGEVLGELVKREISRVTVDEGRVEVIKRDGSYTRDKLVWDPDIVRKMLGNKIVIKEFVERTITEDQWVQNEATYRVVQSFQSVYKVRFDGTRDLVEEKAVGDPRTTRFAGNQA